MSTYTGTVGVTGTLTPIDTNDTYPVVSAEHVKGGYRSVQTKSDLYNIPKTFLSNGSLVRVIDEDTFYIYNEDKSDWDTANMSVNGIDAEYDESTETLILKASDQSTAIEKILDMIYPIGSIYISIGDIKPAFGEWEKLRDGVTLWNDANADGRYIEAGLPNIEGGISNSIYYSDIKATGAFSRTSATAIHDIGTEHNDTGRFCDFDASRSNAIYGASNTVQPPSIAVSMWRRIEPKNGQQE